MWAILSRETTSKQPPTLELHAITSSQAALFSNELSVIDIDIYMSECHGFASVVSTE